MSVPQIDLLFESQKSVMDGQAKCCPGRIRPALYTVPNVDLLGVS
jgi:hypothetical protein